VELKKLLKWARQEPFRPFVVILPSGTEVPVNHAEEIFFLPHPSRVEDILVYSGEDEFVFGPSAVTALRLSRKNGH